MISVPKEWVEETLNDIGEIVTGYTPSTKNDEFYGNDYVFYKPADLNNDIISQTKEGISKLGMNKSRFLPKNSVLVVCIGNSIGKTSIIEKEGISNQQINAIIPNLKKIVPKFLYYNVISNSFQKQILFNAKTSSLPILKKSAFKKLKLFRPSLETQNKIVQKLDLILEQFNEKKHQFFVLKNIPETTHKGRQKKRNSLHMDLIYSSKQTLLDSALEGKITSEWREKHPDVESGVELLKKIQNERKTKFESLQKSKHNKKKYKWENFKITEFKQHHEIQSWATAKLENLIYISGRIGWKGLSTREYTDEGPLFLSVHSLNYGNEVNFDQAFHISQKRYDESPEIQLKENDILLAKDGNIGKIGIVKNLPQSVTVNSSLLVIRSLEAFIPKFLFYVLSGSTLQKLARDRTERVTVPHLYQRDIKNFFCRFLLCLNKLRL